jgi:hypothetical protein
MKTLVFVSLLCAACAGSRSEVASGGYCSINEPRWAAANRDFDRALTLEVIAGLRDAATDDRNKLHAGARGDVGARIDELSRHLTSNAFVSTGVAALGVRLRQLDCAVRKNRMAFEVSEGLYEKIVAELEAERQTLDPSARRAVAPATGENARQ